MIEKADARRERSQEQPQNSSLSAAIARCHYLSLIVDHTPLFCRTMFFSFISPHWILDK